MVSCGDHGELKHVHCDKCDELVWCSRAVPGVTESTGCTVRRANQLVVWSACECYARRGVVYMRQTCRVDSMRGHMSKRSHKYREVTSYGRDRLHATVFG